MNRKEAIAALEAVRALMCAYLPGGDCDCKYGLRKELLGSENYGKVVFVKRPSDERTGCPELRDVGAILEVMSDEDFELYLGMSNGMIYPEKEVGDSGSRVLTDLEKRLGEFKDLVRIQCRTGNFDYDGYMHGYANGMLLAEAVLEGREPEFKKASGRWISKKAQLESENVGVLTGLKQELEKIKAEYRCHPESYDDMSFASTVGVLETILKKYGADEKVIEFSEPMVLPDGSAVMTGQLPLPKDHWIYERAEEPPAPFRMGVGDPLRRCLETRIVEAAKYAVQGATMNGEVMDFDPDALIQNLVVGLFGYCTSDGTHEGGLIPRCPECRERLLKVSGTGVYELYCPKCGHKEKG